MRLNRVARIGCVAAVLMTAGQASAQQIKISQVYGGGGNVGAIYNRDYIELFNSSGAPADVTGWSVQATTSGTSSTWNVIPLPSVVIPAGGYYLIQTTLTGTNGAALPAPDVTVGTAINLSISSGKVALVNDTTQLTGTCTTGPQILDFVGWGTTTNCSEGANGPVTTNPTALLRASDGCQDTQDNSADFSAGAPNPRNSAVVSPCPLPPGADLQIAATTFPTQVTVGENGVYVFSILNNGPESAPDTMLELAIPSGVSFVSSMPPGAPVSGTLTLNLGTIAAGAGTTAEVTLSPDSGLSFVVEPSVSSTEDDAVAGNNSASAASLVFDPVRATLIAGSENASAQLRVVDVGSGAYQNLLTMEVSGLAADNANRRFFVSDGDNLFVIPWDTMSPQLVGTIVGQGTIDMDGLAWDSTRQKLLGTTTAQIYDINHETAVGKSIRLIGGDFGGIDYDPVTDRLFAVNNSTSTSSGLSGRGFYVVDPYGTEVTFLFPYPERIPGTNESDIDGCAVGGGVIYGVTDQMQWIYRYDQTSMMFLDPLPQPLLTDQGDSGSAYAPEFLNQSPGSNVGAGISGPLECDVVDGTNLVFTATIRNFGPSPAADAELEITFPPNAMFVGSVPPLVPVGNVLTLSAGTLAVGDSASVEVTLATTTGPAYPVTATASTSGSDLLPENNSVTREFLAQPTPPATTNVGAVFSTLPGSNEVPGLPGVSFSNESDALRVYRSPNGTKWLMSVDTDAATTEDRVLLRGDGASFEVVAREGVTLMPDGAAVGEFESIYSILDNGDYAFCTDLNTASVSAGAYALKSIGGVSSIVARQSDFNEFIPTAYAILNSITLQDDGTTTLYIFLGNDVFGPNFIARNDGNTPLVQSQIDSPGFQLADPEQTYQFFQWGQNDGQGTYMNPAGTKWTMLGDLNGPTGTDIVLIINNQVQIQEGFPVPGSSFTSNVSAINMNHLETGRDDVMSYGSNADGVDWVWLNGEIIAVRGDEIYPGAGEFFSDAAYSQQWFMATGNCAGDYVIGGLTDAADGNANAVVVLNGTREVLRENDPIDLDGNGMFDDDAYVHVFRDDYAFLSNDGWLYAVVRVRNGAGSCLGAPVETGQALLRVRAFCQGDHNRDGVITVPDIFAFLADWFGGGRKADMDCSGANEVPDIFTFLAAWFAGCPL